VEEIVVTPGTVDEIVVTPDPIEPGTVDEIVVMPLKLSGTVDEMEVTPGTVDEIVVMPLKLSGTVDEMVVTPGTVDETVVTPLKLPGTTPSSTLFTVDEIVVINPDDPTIFAGSITLTPSFFPSNSAIKAL
jgi:hypothetical protein